MDREIDVPTQIRSFLEENFLFGQSQDLKDDDSFLDGGILDSTGILELIAFLGRTYGITVEDHEITPDNLDSIDKVSNYLHRKLKNEGRIPTGNRI